MKLPSNIRTLLALGILSTIGGAWLTFVIDTRTRPSRGATGAQATASKSPVDLDAARPPRSEADPRPSPAGAPTRTVTVQGNADRAVPEAYRERVTAARRELELLEVQKPENFLAIFEMMNHENRWDKKPLEAARAASHGYILARTRMLEGMLRRFIDDPRPITDWRGRRSRVWTMNSRSSSICWRVTSPPWRTFKRSWTPRAGVSG